MSIDVEGLKRAVDLGAVVERYAGAPARRQGRWAWWRCPFHQEKSASFGVTADDGRFKCFGCGVSGDVFEFVRRAEGLGDNPRDFIAVVEKVREMTGVDGSRYTVDGGRASGTLAVPVDDGPPAEKWQDAAGWLVGEARAHLWKAEGAGCVRYLVEERGLREETIRAWGLGWWPVTSYEKASAWGLDREQDVWLPKGLVIPGRVGDTMWYVKFRPAKDVGVKMKYYGIPGGKTALLGADRWREGLPVWMCEGELDLLTVWQTARELVNAGTLGGAAKTLGRWLLTLVGYEQVWVAFDEDKAGDAARALWGQLGERVQEIGMVPFGGDVNGFHVQGGDVRAWIEGVVGSRQQTVDGRREEGWPKVLVFPGDLAVLAVTGPWKRLDDGRVEVVFEDAESLALTLQVAAAVRQYESGSTS